MGSSASLKPRRQEVGGGTDSRALSQQASRQAVLHPPSVRAEGRAAASRGRGGCRCLAPVAARWAGQ